jgi:UPF0716 protein FxsA
MAPWLLLAILLGFPLLELWVAVLVAQKIGWWLLLWLIGAVLIGITLIREQQFALLGNVMRAAQRGADPFQAIFASGRILLAGLLFIFPGVVSDGLALLPTCWCNGTTSFDGNPACAMGVCTDCDLWVGGCTPPWK